MKNIVALVIIFSLTACAHWSDYQPKLATPPENQATYDADRKSCLNNALKRKDTSSLSDADAHKLPREMVDECMTSKGYDVIKVSHSFSDIFTNTTN